MTWVTQVLQAFAKPLKWWVTVATWEQGVLVRMGKKTHHLMPGMHFRIPFLDRVVVVCVRDRVVDTDSRTVSTKDGKPLTFGLAIKYRIADARKMTESVARPESTVQSIVLANASKVVAAHHSSDLTPTILQEETNKDSAFDVWGLAGVEAFVTTFAYTRTLRLLQAHDNGYSTGFDHALDEHPAKVD